MKRLFVRPARHRQNCPYLEALEKLRPRDQRKVNEKMIWAVNQLTNIDGRGPKGTKLFLTERGIQLIKDMEAIGFMRASQRFRHAVTKRKEKKKSGPSNGGFDVRYWEGSTGPTFSPIKTMPYFREIRGLGS